MIPVILGVAVLVAFVVWMRQPKRTIQPEWGETEQPEAPDESELEAAEREVRDLEVHQRPEDGFEGHDWGPGTAGNQKRD